MEQLIYERLKENLARLKLGRIGEIFDMIITAAEQEKLSYPLCLEPFKPMPACH